MGRLEKKFAQQDAGIAVGEAALVARQAAWQDLRGEREAVVAELEAARKQQLKLMEASAAEVAKHEAALVSEEPVIQGDGEEMKSCDLM